MGQYESTNRLFNSNDQLIDELITRECIHSTNVEKVFRSVDRQLYYTNDNKLNAYRETDWQSGDVHLSAPSHYATALECLDLHKGHKFLNIGSGIGYFSTLAGLLLGANGVNHGIEIHSSLIDIAYQKLEVFKETSAAIDYFEFCEPVFIKGNACELMSAGYYDRVYCGAGVPPAESSFMMDLIKIGGVLVMPLNGVLVKVTREDELSWKTIEVARVSIPHLVVSEKCSSMNVLKFPTVEPLSLKELCRSNIRASIRDCLNESHPGLQMRLKCKPIINFDQKLFNEADSGMMSLRSVVDMMCNQETSDLDFTSNNESSEEDDDENNGDDVDVEEKHSSEPCDKSLLKETASDLDFTSNNESSEEDDDENNGDDVDVEEKNSSEPCDKSLLKETASGTKRKDSGAGCSSEQNKRLPKKSENTSSSTVNNLSDIQTTNHLFWETMLNVSPVSSDEENDHNGEDLVDGKINSDSYTVNEVTKFCFLSNRNENEMSKLLKVNINLLPVPAMLKVFLNYNKDN